MIVHACTHSFIYCLAVCERVTQHGMEVNDTLPAQSVTSVYIILILAGCLAVAELGRRGLLLPTRLADGEVVILSMDYV